VGEGERRWRWEGGEGALNGELMLDGGGRAPEDDEVDEVHGGCRVACPLLLLTVSLCTLHTYRPAVLLLRQPLRLRTSDNLTPTG
jgi:hypothetical protein